MSTNEYLLSNLVELTDGPILIGTLTGTFFTGVLWVMALQYFARFPNDRPAYLAVAIFVLALGTVDAGIQGSYAWDCLIVNFGQEFSVLEEPWQFGCMIAFIGTSGLIVCAFLGYRVYVISGRSVRWWAWVAVSIGLSMGSTGISFYLAIWFNRQPLSTSLLTKSALVESWFVMTAVAELMSTIALVYFLVLKPRRIANRTAALPLRGILRRLLVTAVETNLVNLLMQIAIQVTYTYHNLDGYWYAGPGFAMTKVYGLSLFATLLSRSTGTDSFGQSGNVSKGMSTSAFRSGAPIEAIELSMAMQTMTDDHLGGEKQV